MEENQFEQKERRYKIIIGILTAIIIILSIGWITSSYKVRTIVLQASQANTMKESLKAELDSLLKEHDRIKTEYGNVTRNLKGKDSIILANAEEIRDLLNYKYDYNKVKRKLDLLRNITQTYVRQIDSLLVVNKSLKNENVEIKDYLSKEKEKVVVLNKEKDNLSEKVTKASMLKAYNVSGTTIHQRRGTKEETTAKARRTDGVKVCFTLSENPVAAAGKRTIYIRIARPDNVIITEGTEYSTFTFNGEKIQYTMKKEVDYDNKAQNICLSWYKRDKKTDAMPGKYNVSVFCDDYEIGQTSFDLK
jgi:hypothetical protein